MICNMSENPLFRYYTAPRIPDGVRFNMGENPIPAGLKKVELEQPSGRLAILSLKLFMPGQEVSSDGSNKLLVLINGGMGKITREDEDREFFVSGVPAIFYAARGQKLQFDGTFSGWVLELRQNKPDDLEDKLPNIAAASAKSSPITEKIFTEDDLKEKLNKAVIDRFPKGRGELIKWAMGQWNSTCPLNVALGTGGLGSYRDEMQIEPGVVEIHLINRGRTVYHLENGNRERFDFPTRRGNVVVINPDIYSQRERYSDYSEFCIKWGTEPGKLIDPKAKFYRKDMA